MHVARLYVRKSAHSVVKNDLGLSVLINYLGSLIRNSGRTLLRCILRGRMV